MSASLFLPRNTNPGFQVGATHGSELKNESFTGGITSMGVIVAAVGKIESTYAGRKCFRTHALTDGQRENIRHKNKCIRNE